MSIQKNRSIFLVNLPKVLFIKCVQQRKFNLNQGIYTLGNT